MKNRLEKKSCLNNPAKLSLHKKLQPLWPLALVLFIVIFMCGAFKEHRLLAVVKNNCDIKNNSLPKNHSFKPGEVWYDTEGQIINAHGGGILYYHGVYYWFGEKRGTSASEGVSVYSSHDLYNWQNEGTALAHAQDASSDITVGSVFERPKVIYNESTKQFVMWFHLELKGQGYRAARAAVAVSSSPAGPYRYLKSFRPNGNMSRDMTLYVDGKNHAYQIYSSRDNYDMRIVQLTDDYLSPTPKDSLIASDHREAPAIFQNKGSYFLITSACTGWAPNEANVYKSSSLFGPWKNTGDPMHGTNSQKTFDAQSTFVLPIAGKKKAFIFMADKWNPKDLMDSRYIWLPVEWKDDKPFIEWRDEWDLSFFSKM